MDSTLVPTGSGAPQTNFTVEYQEGIDTLEYSPDIEFTPKAALPFQNPQDAKDSKVKEQTFPATEDHAISIHLVKTLAMHHDLNKMENWVDESLTTLEQALGDQKIDFSTMEILNDQQIESLKRLLGRSHITFNDYKDAVHHKNHMLRTYVMKIWNYHHFKPEGRPDAIIYSDVVRMKLMFPNLHKLAKTTVIGTTSLIGANPKLSIEKQLHNYTTFIDQQVYKKDPKCFSMLVALQDTVSAISHHMHDVATVHSRLVPSDYDIKNSSGRVIDVITSGAMRGNLSPQGLIRGLPLGTDKSVVNNHESKGPRLPTYSGPGVNFNNLGIGQTIQSGGGLSPNLGGTVTGTGGGVTGGVGIGINFDTAAAQALIQEIITVLTGLEVIIMILSSNGFNLIQAMEEMLDSLIDQLAEELMMESMSIISMVQGEVMAPLTNLMFQLDLNIGPFTVDVDAWTNAAELVTSAIESITGRFYGRLLDWYRKMLQQLNGAINKMGPTSSNNQYGHLMAIINEIISWLEHLNFAELNVVGGQTLQFIAPKLDFSTPSTPQVQVQTPLEQTPPSIQAIKDKVVAKLHARYKNVARLSAPPKMVMSFPHIQSKIENTILQAPMGRVTYKGSRQTIASDILSDMR